MNILFLDNNSKIFDSIYRNFLVNKITPYFYNINKPSNFMDFPTFINKNQCNIIIINIDNTKIFLEKINNTLNNNSLINKLKIILISKNDYDKSFDKIIKNNVIKYIKYNSINELFKNILNTLNKLEYVNDEKRKYIRFNLKQLNIKIGFKNPINSRIFTGELINVSFGGLSFKTFKSDKTFSLIKNKIINDFKIFFTETPFLCDIKIVYINQNIFCGQFLKIEQNEFEKFINFIKNFILTKDSL